MKVGDLVKWRADGEMGIVLSVSKGSLISGDCVVYVMWFDGLLGPLPDDHEELEVISESR